MIRRRTIQCPLRCRPSANSVIASEAKQSPTWIGAISRDCFASLANKKKPRATRRGYEGSSFIQGGPATRPVANSQ